MKTWLGWVVVALAFGWPGAAAQVTDVGLKPQARAEYDQFCRSIDTRVEAEIRGPGAFLFLDGLSAPDRARAYEQLRRGEIFMQQLDARDASGQDLEPPDALLHHWVGAVFIPGAKLADVLHVAQDYNHHQDYYKPEVVRSRLVSREGDEFKIFYRLRKKKVITVTLDTDHDVHYTPVDATHEWSRSHATRIAEVENAGQPDERLKPPGHDGGFMWGLDSWWRFEERDGGVYAECESVSLTRDIPFGLAWLIKPFVTGIPKESLQNTLGSTRTAVLGYVAGERKAQAARVARPRPSTRRR